jgi:hypothetical protein
VIHISYRAHPKTNIPRRALTRISQPAPFAVPSTGVNHCIAFAFLLPTAARHLEGESGSEFTVAAFVRAALLSAVNTFRLYLPNSCAHRHMAAADHGRLPRHRYSGFSLVFTVADDRFVNLTDHHPHDCANFSRLTATPSPAGRASTAPAGHTPHIRRYWPHPGGATGRVRGAATAARD